MKQRRSKEGGLPAALAVSSCLVLLCCPGCSGEDAAREHGKIDETWVLDVEGWWVERPDAARSGPLELTAEQREEIERLNAIGYLDGYQPPADEVGVTRHARDMAWQGLNLCVSGHRPEALLMDMDGTVLFRWSRAYDDIPNAPEVEDGLGKHAWRRVYLYPDGGLLAIHEGLGLVKLDRASQVEWYWPGRAHHDLFVAPEGDIHVLGREARMIPHLNPKTPILEDFICRLDAEGREQSRLSLIECFENSPFAAAPLRAYQDGGDVFHTNTLERIERSFADRQPAFRPGNFLISIRNLHALAIVDPERGSIAWAQPGPWRTQHEPQLLEDGNILLFDNTGYHGHSRVMEIDVLDSSVAWVYVGDPPERFSSRFCGAVQRLPNGNTLITESCAGRAFEVTRETQEIVWEYVNPHRAGEDGQLIAALLDVVRLPPDFPTDWISE